MTWTEDGPGSPGSGPRPEQNGSSNQEDSSVRSIPSKVWSDPDRWEAVPMSRTAGFCGQMPIRAASHVDGSLFSMKSGPCDGWTHQECAEARANELFDHLKLRWLPLRSVYLTSFPTDKRTFDRIRQRPKRDGADYRWVWVKRSIGMTYYLATSPRPGREIPTDWVELPTNTLYSSWHTVPWPFPASRRFKPIGSGTRGSRDNATPAARATPFWERGGSERLEDAQRIAAERVQQEVPKAFQTLGGRTAAA